MDLMTTKTISINPKRAAKHASAQSFGHKGNSPLLFPQTWIQSAPGKHPRKRYQETVEFINHSVTPPPSCTNPPHIPSRLKTSLVFPLSAAHLFALLGPLQGRRTLGMGRQSALIETHTLHAHAHSRCTHSLCRQ